MSMLLRRVAKTTTHALITPGLSAALLGCSGTEADNPVTEDVVITACKSEADYDPTRVGSFLDGRLGAAGIAGGGVPKSGEPSGASEAMLTPTAAIPLSLECVEWSVSEGTLAVQVVNFGSGCGVEWQGYARPDDDRVSLVLSNRICAVAACGSCLYDTAAVLEAPSTEAVALALSLDAACSGDPEVREWSLPLARTPRGMICDYATPMGLGGSSGAAFERCRQPDGGCDEGSSCIADGETDRCLPNCASDADCPLSGGTRCETGFCVPQSASSGSPG